MILKKKTPKKQKKQKTKRLVKGQNKGAADDKLHDWSL